MASFGQLSSWLKKSKRKQRWSASGRNCSAMSENLSTSPDPSFAEVHLQQLHWLYSYYRSVMTKMRVLLRKMRFLLLRDRRLKTEIETFIKKFKMIEKCVLLLVINLNLVLIKSFKFLIAGKIK